eukprot:PhM_4_TR17376/c0_g1_i1/m.22403
MRRRTIVIAVVFMCLILFIDHVSAAKPSRKPKKREKMPLELTTEELHSKTTPPQYMCDVCIAVGMQLFNAFNKNQLNDRRLKLEDIITFVEDDGCDIDRYHHKYLIKKAEDGSHVIAGPALKTSELPGKGVGGGRLPYWMKDTCLQFGGEVGEQWLYDLYMGHRGQDGSPLMFIRDLCLRFERCTREAMIDKIQLYHGDFEGEL